MNKIPFILFMILASFFAVLLLKGKNPAIVESAMIGKPAPALEVLQERPAVVNFFASWCLECGPEQTVLKKIGEIEKIPIYGVDYKDTPEKLAPWLKKYGNPYTKIGTDRDGRMAIDWGVYGVPETFIVDVDGIIRYKHVGAVTEEVYQEILKPVLAGIKK